MYLLYAQIGELAILIGLYIKFEITSFNGVLHLAIVAAINLRHDAGS